ncbi:MAG: HAD-IB family hydrolase [Gammaproteobacteria bacterium]|nr:HAD-IB family hydrolase [Gammaproteobacteria bacterium]MDH5734643.1 HAD-IB family hydrolase [Gammaproteobacteria bacterium]
MALALFDLDNTLLSGDSDYLWGCFLAEKGLVARDYYERENQRFYDEYKRGTLDIFEFLAFSLKPLADNEPDVLSRLQQQFLDEKIRPLMSPASFELIDKHKQANDTLVVITATNSFVTRPIVKAFGIENLLATEPEIINSRYTGKVDGTPCFQEGKVTRLTSWMQEHHLNLQGSWFYSDSHNDIPLLKQVDNPVAVDPDEQLHELAIAENWPIISLRHTWK